MEFDFSSVSGKPPKNTLYEEPDNVPLEGQVTEPVQSGDLTCIVCGKGLTYGGRGPRPKYCEDHKKGSKGSSTGQQRKRSTADVDNALAILGGMYDATTMGLLMVSPNAAKRWVSGIPDLQRTNAVALSSDKDLCDAVNRMGKTNAKVVFFGAHVLALAPVVVELRHDIISRRQAKTQEPLFDIPDDASGAYQQQQPPEFPNQRFFG